MPPGLVKPMPKKNGGSKLYGGVQGERKRTKNFYIVFQVLSKQQRTAAGCFGSLANCGNPKQKCHLWFRQ